MQCGRDGDGADRKHNGLVKILIQCGSKTGIAGVLVYLGSFSGQQSIALASSLETSLNFVLD